MGVAGDRDHKKRCAASQAAERGGMTELVRKRSLFDGIGISAGERGKECAGVISEKREL